MLSTPEVSHIVLSPDTNWIQSKLDNNEDSIKTISLIVSADFSFTITNNSENKANLMLFQILDTTNSKPKSLEKLFQGKSKEIVPNGTNLNFYYFCSKNIQSLT